MPLACVVAALGASAGRHCLYVYWLRGDWLVSLAQFTWRRTGTPPGVVLQQASLLVPHMQEHRYC